MKQSHGYVSNLCGIYERLEGANFDQKNKMSIAIISPGLYPWKIGGEEYYVFCVAKELASCGHKICVIAGDANHDRDAYFTFSNNLRGVLVRSTHYSHLELFRKALQYSIAAFETRFKPDLVHGHDPYAQGLAAVLVGKILRVPVIITWHGAELIEGNFTSLGNLVRRFVISQADRTIVNTQFVKELAIQNTRLEPKKFRVIQPGVDLERFHADLDRNRIRHRYGLEDSPVVLCVCRLERSKGVHMLIESIPVVVEKIPNVRFLIVGDGPEKENLRSLATRLGVSNSVLFVGFVEDGELPYFYSCCDAFILPTLAEGFGLVFLEAWASGKPIIVTPQARDVSILTSQSGAGIVAKADPLDIGKALLELLSNPKMRKDMGMIGRKIVESSFSWEKTSIENLEIYKELVRVRPGLR